MQLDNKVLTSTKNTMHAKSMDLIVIAKFCHGNKVDQTHCLPSETE